MREILLAFLFLVCGVTVACKQNDETAQSILEQDKIYLFYHNGCPYCHKAMEYINAKYPDLSISLVNTSDSSGYRLFVQCARKFRLGNSIGTPLFCMGDNYLMGWGNDAPRQFDEYVKPFIQ